MCELEPSRRKKAVQYPALARTTTAPDWCSTRLRKVLMTSKKGNAIKTGSGSPSKRSAKTRCRFARYAKPFLCVYVVSSLFVRDPSFKTLGSFQSPFAVWQKKKTLSQSADNRVGVQIAGRPSN